MKYINVRNANNNNLKNISIDIPLGKFVVFVGKSGSGKSTLAADVIVGGSLINSPNVKTPIQPALFRQRVIVPMGTNTVRNFLDDSQNNSITLLDSLANNKSVKNAALFSEISKRIGISHLELNTNISRLSLTQYNRLRFIKFLLEIKTSFIVVDELAAGMSFSEANALADVFIHLTEKDYSVLAIEHSLPLITKANFIVEMGPNAGMQGGKVMFCGNAKKYKTTDFWEKTVDASLKITKNAKPSKKLLKICSIDYHGLQIAELTIPSFCIVNIIGVAGVGKSVLLDIVYRAFDKSVNAWKNRDGIHGMIGGKEYIRRPYFIDQSPIGNNSMSTPATYTKIMDILRDLYEQTAIENNLQYTSSDFSYNSTGKCKTCGGRGVIEISTGDDIIFNACSVCNGRRFQKSVEKVLVENLSIGDVLKISCGELSSKFVNRPALHSKIDFISDVGLSYLTLGQPSTSLSGGESQRIKITKELSKRLGDRCLFILDTPSKGLHVLDFENVLTMLSRLVAKNNSVLVCDNNPYFVKNSDWIIALDEKSIAYQGTPENIPKKISQHLGLDLKI